MKSVTPRWTPEEIETLRIAALAGKTTNEAAAILKRGIEATRNKAKQHGIVLKAGDRTRKPKAVAEAIVVRHIVPKFVKPASLTGFLMGDPPPGRSALDQKRSNH